jgi:hypothetical protein
MTIASSTHAHGRRLMFGSRWHAIALCIAWQFARGGDMQRLPISGGSGPSPLPNLRSIRILFTIEVICIFCFSRCNSLTSVIFEVDMQFSDFGERALCVVGLASIQIPFSVAGIDSFRSSRCKSLAFARFASVQISFSVEVICEACVVGWHC